MNKLTAPLAALALLAFAAGRADAVTLSLEPAVQFASPPDIVMVDLVVSGLTAGGPDSLGDFDLDIGFDPAALGFLGYALGAHLGDLGLGEAADFSFGEVLPGIVNLSEVSLLEPDDVSCFLCFPPYLDDIQPASFVLATLEFEVLALAPGASTLVGVDTVWALGDGFGDPLALDGVSAATITNPLVQASAPVTALLVALGLIGVAARRRV